MELQVIDKREIVTMTSLEVVDLINNFRKEEGNEVVKRHDDFIRSIRKEVEILESVGIKADRNFTEGLYKDKNNQERPCYQMNKSGVMQMLNKESALVRYKTQQYIEVLENKSKETSKPLSPMELLKLQYKALEEQDKKIEEVDKKVEQKFDNLPLFPSDSKVLKKLANQTVVPLLGGKKSNAYKKLSRKVFSDLYKQIHREFDVVGCEEIKRKDLEFAKEIIYNYKLPRAVEEEIKLLNSQVAFA
ncbi:ORF6C domain-containing protein [Paraclostridium bifermentans]|uniref:ORF6C domain-containing protein n=1 Tax=Paraclostridium bifermentans TaxID=1490 RepID=UPI001D0182FB|nr:ORF6C domain-containing protein [Paraclostridium bifermentans]GIM32755.1 antirepressor [Paraclostridium bifermentans subsp. muricolitidis]